MSHTFLLEQILNDCSLFAIVKTVNSNCLFLFFDNSLGTGDRQQKLNHH